MTDQRVPRNEEFSTPTLDMERRKQLHDDLLDMERSVETFLDGEINNGLITSYKLTVITTARLLRAVVQTARQDLIDNRVDLG